MNILVVGKFYTEAFALHIEETLAAMGHEVRRFESGFPSNRIGGRFGQRVDQVCGVLHSATDNIPAFRAFRMRNLWETVKVGDLDLVIVCHDYLWPAEVAELKQRTGALVTMWFPDSLGTIGRGLFMNAPYDALFFKDPFIVNRLEGVLSSPIYYLPECFNPEKHWLPEDLIRDDAIYRCDVGTVGNSHAYRIAFFKHLANYNVKQWGNHPPLWLRTGSVAQMHQGRQVFNHEKVRAFRGAKIVVNNLLFAEIWGVNVRTFEIAGCGAFQLVDWRPALSELFVDGKELVSFRSIKDLNSKIRYWLPREEERRAIGDAGMRRAHAEHTYQLRLVLLLDTLAGKANGYPSPKAQ